MNPCPTQPSPITPSRRFPATAGLRLNCRVMSIGYIAIDPTLVECWDYELRGRRRHHGGRDLRRRDVDSRAVAPAACLWGRSLAEAQGQRPSAPRGWFGLPRRGPLVRGSRDRPRRDEDQAVPGRLAMPQTEPTGPFLLCVRNEGYPASLEVRKVYQALPDPVAASRGFVRVFDESGEDYLYPSECFVAVELPQAAARVFAGAM